MTDPVSASTRTPTKIFLSHAGGDKDLVRNLGVHLQVVGAEVFFDEWSIGFGESITDGVEKALKEYDVFVLAWSADAAASPWTGREYKAALKTFIEQPTRRLVVLRLDATPIPELVNDLKYLDLSAVPDLGAATDAIMGFAGPAIRIMAIQRFLEEGHIEVSFQPGYGPVVGCRKCGAGLEAIEAWSQWDDDRDDLYAGIRCTKCDWQDGGEL